MYISINMLKFYMPYISHISKSNLDQQAMMQSDPTCDCADRAMCGSGDCISGVWQ